MRKRILFVMIALALLTGCNGNIQVDNGTSKDIAVQSNEKEYTPPKMEGEITISAVFEQEFMTIAAKQFMAKYPNVKVTINTFRDVSKDVGIIPSDYRNFLNTKIMTGKAEDIIFTAYLPVKKYTDMGVFEDLSHFLSLSPDINAEHYFMNVLEASKDANSKLYVLPLTFSFEVISFDNQLVSENSSQLDKDMTKISFEKALALAQRFIDGTSKKNAFLSPDDGAHFFNNLKGNLKEFVDMEHRQASINTERYIALLKQTKDLVDRGYFAAENSIDFYNMEYYFALIVSASVQESAFFSLVSSSSGRYALPRSDADGNVYMNSGFGLGINSASTNKDLAWQFVKFLLSDEMQSSPSFYHDLCVNRNGFEASVERNLKMYNSNNNENVSKEAYKKLLEKWIIQINTYDTHDPAIEDFFWEENGKFFEGKQSAQETARILQAKVDKYLNE